MKKLLLQIDNISVSIEKIILDINLHLFWFIMKQNLYQISKICLIYLQLITHLFIISRFS